MYELGMLALFGLATAKTVDFTHHLYKDMKPSFTLFLSALLGVAYSYVFDFSLFAGWGIGVRYSWLGYVGTGLFMMGMATLWHHALGMMKEWAHHHHGEAEAIESKLRAA